MGQQDNRTGSRLILMATFGLGVAVLAGVAVVPVASGPAPAASHVMTTTALGAAIDGAAGAGPMTTCCGPSGH